MNEKHNPQNTSTLESKQGQWTDEQYAVIQQRNSNLLVAAAAGSGKTAVMVERIIQRLLNDEKLDIDRIVVVTFTKAAANEMKERIGIALSKAYDKEEDNRKKSRIRKQILLLDNALICTIDSFCNYILRNYFNVIDLDPAYRIGDNGELKLLMSDVADEVIEEAYEKAEEEFIDFVEGFVPGKSDKKISEWILNLYNFSQSHPFPEKWLKKCKEWYEIDNEQAFEKSGEIQFIMNHTRQLVKDMMFEIEQAVEILNSPAGIDEYISTFEKDYELLERIYDSDSYATMMDCIGSKFSRLPNAPKDCDGDIKEYAQNIRNGIKKSVAKLQTDFFSHTISENLDIISHIKAHANAIIDLTLNFSEKYASAKEENNILSFSDLEHLALNVLLRENDESVLERTFVAEELSKLYEEIYIDEYQDSNMVQELILSSISRNEVDFGNMFMVGDIKQSIYSFRQANPKIFLGKYNGFSEDRSKKDVLIVLHKNFRSRQNVLFSVNDIFNKVMHKELGGVEYDKEASLVPGKVYKENKELDITKIRATELLIYDESKDTDENKANSVIGALSADATDDKVKTNIVEKSLSDVEIEIEKRRVLAKAVAKRIKELIEKDKMQVWDSKLENGAGGYRGLCYRDIVILLRSANVSGPEYAEELMNQNIPAVCNSVAGYFKAREIVQILNLLAVIDNPYQDIPFTAVLRSYFCYLSAEELAHIRAVDREKKLGMYECVKQYITDYKDKNKGPETSETDKIEINEGYTTDKDSVYDFQEQLEKVNSEKNVADNSIMHEEDEDLKKQSLCIKLSNLLEFVNEYREISQYTPIHELIRMLIYDTGYISYVASMRSGKKRVANLDMLITKAAEYESTSFHGVFNFLRYIDKMKKYEIEMGEADVFSENDDVVRIMSIHKSKGLEFPVVFVGDMDKKYNFMDNNERINFNEEFGIAMDYVNTSLRIRRKSIIKKILTEKNKLDIIGEELRVLYVALTRASEKLILVGSVKDSAKSVEKWNLRNDNLPGNYEYVYSSTNYLDLCAPAFLASDSERTAEFIYKIFGYRELLEEVSFFESDKDTEENSDFVSDNKMELIGDATEVNELTNKLQNIDKSSSIKEEQNYYRKTPEDKLKISLMLAKKASNEAVTEIKNRFSADYAYSASVNLPGKLSVSELKHESIADSEIEGVMLVESPEDNKPIPYFMKQEKVILDNSDGEMLLENSVENLVESNDAISIEGIETSGSEFVNTNEVSYEKGAVSKASGSERGNAYHKLFELLDYKMVTDYKSLNDFILRIVSEGKMSKEYAELINRKKMLMFLESSLGKRMRKAAIEGCLYREKQFVTAFEAKKLKTEYAEADDYILIQGIVDAYFVENDEIVLVDYKTDRVTMDNYETVLKGRYEKQLDLYGNALEKMTGKPVKEHIIYSVSVNKELSVKK